MAAQEVIDELQYAINLIKQDGKDWIDERDIPILETAISALEKQIPKHPNMPLDAYWICPVCGKKVEHPYEHCRGCGQAILWSESE